MLRLSKRLACIAHEIEKIAEKEDILADIGTDHAYLPCFLVESKVISYAYGSEVARGPLSSSIETIESEGLTNQVIPLLGNGLETILNKKIDIISIAGMGGLLMEEIFDAHIDELDPKYIVVQPNICIHVIRACLNRHGYSIIHETMVEDAHHIYEILVFAKGQQKLNNTELQFGPILLQDKPKLFDKKWNYELSLLRRILPSLSREHPRYQEVMEEIQKIQEVLL